MVIVIVNEIILDESENKPRKYYGEDESLKNIVKMVYLNIFNFFYVFNLDFAF
jgi:hypothetical protein